MLSWPTLEGVSAGNSFTRQAPEVVERGREGRGRGGKRNHKDGEEEEQHNATSGKAGGGKADSPKGEKYEV